MGVDVEQLIIQPFREVVQLGNTALENAVAASDDDPELAERMSKAAGALVREGERALKKLQPLWDGQIEKYGDAFRDLMMQQDIIEKKRRVLEDLLYDFEDFTEADAFDVEKFAELQAATKSLALDAIDIAKRQKLELPKPPALPAGGKFPPLPPLPLSVRKEYRPPSRQRPRSSPKWRDFQTELASPIHGPAVTATVEEESGYWDTMSLRTDRESTRQSVHSSGSNDAPAIPPRDRRPPPSPGLGPECDQFHASIPLNRVSNDTLASVTSRASMKASSASRPRRPLVWKHASRDTMTTDYASTEGSTLSRLDSLSVDGSSRSASVFDLAPSPTTSEAQTSFRSHCSSFTTSPAVQAPDSPSIVEEVLDELDREIEGLPNRPPTFIRQAHDITKFEPMTQVLPVMLPEPMIESEKTQSVVGTPSAVGEPPLAETVTESTQEVSPKLEYPRQADSVINHRSTFHRLGGFCKGAERFRNDGHWHSIKPTVGYLSYKTSMIGRCNDCGYAHSMEEVKLDMDGKPEAAFNMYGTRFRVRLLYKSHLSVGLTAKRDADAQYACVFCVQAGAACREGEATVFRNFDDLVKHIARHPQPLNPVPGVVVQYGPMEKTDLQDYDLHLPLPPAPNPVPESVAKQATAIATKDHFFAVGRKKLSTPPRYGGQMLHFMEGAVIVGVTFPEKWEGKWCLGWHDGAFGAFPVKVVEIRPPQESEIPVGGGSGMSVKSKWKWHPPEPDADSPWLQFEKGEVISDVKCLYADYWCWAGTNSKGQHGVFPQSHIDLNNLSQQQDPTMRPGSRKQSWQRSIFNRRMSSSAASSFSRNTRQSSIMS